MGREGAALGPRELEAELHRDHSCVGGGQEGAGIRGQEVWFGEKWSQDEGWTLMTSVKEGHLRGPRGQKQWGEEQSRWGSGGSVGGNGPAGRKLQE